MALLQVARAEWERQLCPFVPDCPDVEQVLTELQPKVVEIWKDFGEGLMQEHEVDL